MPVRLAFGVAMLVLGVLGLFLPFLQGILFISIGLLVLAHDIPAVGRIMEGLKRHPWTQRLRAWGQRFRKQKTEVRRQNSESGKGDSEQ